MQRGIVRKCVLLSALLAPASPSQNLVTNFLGADWLFPRTPIKALDAPFGIIPSVVLAPNGDLLFSDFQNHMVFRLSESGIVNAVAGSGVAGFSGDGGPATAACLRNPAALAVDRDGTIYVTDTGNFRIRKIAPDGVITTFAGTGQKLFAGDGGLAVQARLQPSLGSGIAIDTAGAVLVSDSDNNRVRRINRSGLIETIAGNGKATFSGEGGSPLNASIPSPGGLLVDPAGNLYIGTMKDTRLLKVGTDGILRTVAFTGQDGFSGENVPALRATARQIGDMVMDALGNLYLADVLNSTVRKITPAGIVSTIQVNRARIPTQYKVGLDAAGNLITGDSIMRRLGTDGVNRVIAGNGQFRISGDTANPATLILRSPKGLYSANGNVFIAESGANRVLRVNLNGTIDSIAGNGQTGFCGDGGPATAACVWAPNAVTSDRVGNMFVSEMWGSRIRKVGPDGRIQSFAGNGKETELCVEGAAPLATSVGVDIGRLATGADGALYFNCLQKWRERGAVNDSTYNAIARVAPNGPLHVLARQFVGGCSGTCDGRVLEDISIFPYGFATDPVGYLHFLGSAGVNPALYRVEADGSVRRLAGGETYQGTSKPTFTTPHGIVIDPSANIFVADAGSNRILKVAPGGTVSTFAGNGQRASTGNGGIGLLAAIDTPRYLALDSSGNIYVTDEAQQRVRVIRAKPPVFASSNPKLEFTAFKGQTGVSKTVYLASSILPTSYITFPSARWIVPEPATGVAPGDFRIRLNTSSLEPGHHEGKVLVTPAAGAAQEITVVLDLSGDIAPVLRLGTQQTAISPPRFLRDPAAGGLVSVSNDGGGSLNFQASIVTEGGDWLAVTPASGSLESGASIPLVVTPKTTDLPPGTYQGKVTIESNAGTSTATVNLTVTREQPKISLSHSGLTFTAVAGGGQAGAQALTVINEGTGRLLWSARATTTGGGDWLILEASNGIVDRPLLDSSTVRVRANSSGLAPGDYYGQVQFTATGAASRSATVLFKVLPAGANPGPEMQPSGLVFTGRAGESPGARAIDIANLLSRPLAYSSVRFSLSGGEWFTHLPETSVVPPNEPGRILVVPDFSILKQSGVYRGVLSIAFADGSTRTVSVMAVVTPASPSVATSAGESCSPKTLRIAFRSFSSSFTVQSGDPVQIEASVVDDCGEPLTLAVGANVLVSTSFDNGDPGVRLSHAGAGVWTGTWYPSRAAENVTMTINGLYEGDGLTKSGADGLTGTVRARTSSAAPSANSLDLFHDATRARSLLAPGGVYLLVGSGIANSEAVAPPDAPWPLEIDGTSLLLGDRPLPIRAVTPNRIEFMGPFDLEPGSQVQLVIRHGTHLSQPIAFPVAQAAPGLLTADSTGTGQGLVYHGDQTTLMDADHPAEPGEEASVLATGLGPVDPIIAPGTPSTVEPLSRATLPVAITIGETPAEVLGAELVPGSYGVYRVRFLIPAGVSGADLLLSLRAANIASQPVMISVK